MILAVAIVAGFDAQVHGAIAAARRGAGSQTAILIVVVAVVAGFATLNDTIAAVWPRCDVIPTRIVTSKTGAKAVITNRNFLETFITDFFKVKIV